MSQPVRLLVFDMDQTLIPDDELAAEAAAEAAQLAPSGVAGDRLRDDLLAVAAVMLQGNPAMQAICDRYGISANECLWGDFPDCNPGLPELRAGTRGFRVDSWRAALARQAADDEALAETLAREFAVVRRRLHRRYPETDAALNELAERYELALLTNGAPSLQSEKVAGTGLGAWFATVVISGQLDTAKPDPATYARVMEETSASPSEAVMIGDNPVGDVAGAQAFGMRAILVDRGSAPPPGFAPDAVIDHVGQLSPALAKLEA